MPDLERLGGVYRLAAAGCAEAIFRAPWVEPAFVRLSRQWWNMPAAGRFIRSVAYRLAHRLFETGRGIRTLSVGGLSLRLDVGEWTTSGYYFANVPYEPATVAYLVSQLQDGDVFVDVGANSGYFTVLGATLVGTAGRVEAFEPNPVVRRRLELNVQRNGLRDRVRVHGCALSDRNADGVRLFVPAHDGFATLVPDTTHAPQQMDGAAAVDVRTQTFDDWWAGAGLDRISLMKIDVEGAEAQVLAGMAQTLGSGRVARIVLETAWDSPSHRLLLRHGYTPQRIESVGPVDNIVYTKP